MGAVAPLLGRSRLVRAPPSWRGAVLRHTSWRGALGGSPFSTEASPKKADPTDSLPAAVRENFVGMGQVSRPARRFARWARARDRGTALSARAHPRRWSTATASTRAH